MRCESEGSSQIFQHLMIFYNSEQFSAFKYTQLRACESPLHGLKRPKILDPHHAQVVYLFPSRNKARYLVRMVGSPFTERAHLLAQIKHECTSSMAVSAGINPGPQDAIWLHSSTGMYRNAAAATKAPRGIMYFSPLSILESFPHTQTADHNSRKCAQHRS